MKTRVIQEVTESQSPLSPPPPPPKRRIARKRKNQANKCQRKGKNTRKAKHKSKPTKTEKWVDGFFMDYDEEDSKFKDDSTLPDDVKCLETELDTFHFLLSKEVIEQIAYQTNLYSTQVNPGKPAKVTTSEMETNK